MKVRHNKVILRGFEQHFIFLSFITVITGLLLMLALIAGALWLIDPVLLGGVTPQQALYIAAAGFALLALIYYYTIRINHRVAGPVFVLLRNLERLGEGDLSTEMRLRQQDHLKEIADSFNRNVGSLRKQIKDVKECVHALQHASGVEEIRMLTERLQSLTDRIRI